MRVLIALIALPTVAECSPLPPNAVREADGYHVFPGQNIQEALDAAAKDPELKTVKVHAGVYRPAQAGQALIWLNRKHDGIRLEAVGAVTLTAANAALSDASRPSHPAVVNHVVYFGDGVTSNTVFKGFKITGARDYFHTNGAAQVEPNGALTKGLFFYGDGGGIKVFGRSYPLIEGVELFDNYASPCAGGLSIEHDGHGPGTSPEPVVIRDCVFRNNRAQVNGAALDLLPGSFAVMSNCLFVGNEGNLGFNYVTDPRLPPLFTNAAVVCVFEHARLLARNCTVTGNRNGIHDRGQTSSYENCVVYANTLPGGFYTSRRYEFHVEGRAQVSHCWIGGTVLDPNGCISGDRNTLGAPPPEFDERHVPTSPRYAGIGYRPAGTPGTPARPAAEYRELRLMTDRDREKYNTARPE